MRSLHYFVCSAGHSAREADRFSPDLDGLARRHCDREHRIESKAFGRPRKAVRRYLIGKGIAADRLNAGGRSESEPIVDNDSDANREGNRRVEFLVQ